MLDAPVSIAADDLMVQSWAMPVHEFLEWLAEYFDTSLVDIPDFPSSFWVKICINENIGADGQKYGVVRYRKMYPREVRAYKASPANGAVTVEPLTVVKMRGPQWFGFYAEIDWERFEVYAEKRESLDHY